MAPLMFTSGTAQVTISLVSEYLSTARQPTLRYKPHVLSTKGLRPEGQ